MDVVSEKLDIKEVIEGWSALLRVIEIAKVPLEDFLVLFYGMGALAETGVSPWGERGSRPLLKRRKGVLESGRPLSVGEICAMALEKKRTWSRRPILGIVIRSQRERHRGEQLLLFRQPEESAEVVLDISDGVGAFALGAEIVFHEAVECWERLMILLKRTMLRVRTVQGFRKRPHGGFDIFPSVGGKGWGELIMQCSEQHRVVLVQNFLGLCQ
jgi:hypothetical protein